MASTTQDHLDADEPGASRRAALKAIVGAGAAAAAWQAPRIEGFSVVPDYAAACSNNPTQLITNGNFNSAFGTSGNNVWICGPIAGGHNCGITGSGESGNGGYLWVGTANPNTEQYFYQTVTGLKVGCMYRLTARINILQRGCGTCGAYTIQTVSCTAGGAGNRYFGFRDTSNAMIKEGRLQGTNCGWNSYQIEFQAAATSVRVFFGAFINSCSGGTACTPGGSGQAETYIDNVSMVEFV